MNTKNPPGANPTLITHPSPTSLQTEYPHNTNSLDGKMVFSPGVVCFSLNVNLTYIHYMLQYMFELKKQLGNKAALILNGSLDYESVTSFSLLVKAKVSQLKIAKDMYTMERTPMSVWVV